MTPAPGPESKIAPDTGPPLPTHRLYVPTSSIRSNTSSVPRWYSRQPSIQSTASCLTWKGSHIPGPHLLVLLPSEGATKSEPHPLALVFVDTVGHLVPLVDAPQALSVVGSYLSVAPLCSPSILCPCLDLHGFMAAYYSPPPRPVLSGQHFSCYSVSLFSPLCLSTLSIVFVYEKFNSVCIFQLWVPLQCVKFWLHLRVSKHGHSRNRWSNVSSFSSQNLHKRS